MIRSLLLRNISVWQIICYALATLAGIVIVGCAVQFYNDLAGALSPSDNENAVFSDSYIVVSKPVSVLGAFGRPASFSADEIADLKAQPWADDAATFVAANFSVTASVDFAGRGFATQMFLEALPDEFIDVRPDGWDYNPGAGGCVPVIISKDYLALYNFGFATARGLPQVTPEMLSQVPLSLTISGNGTTCALCARIVGFSSRLNTIAVPMSFMTYANSLLAPGIEPEPSRLIVRLRDGANSGVDTYLDEHGYETSGAGAETSRAASLLRLLTGIVIAVGAVISALALLILLLSIGLVIRKNHDTIADLLFLGSTPRQVARCYIYIILTVNVAVTLLGAAAVIAAAGSWESLLAPFGITASGLGAALGIITGVLILLTAINAITISRNIRHIFNEYRTVNKS